MTWVSVDLESQERPTGQARSAVRYGSTDREGGYTGGGRPPLNGYSPSTPLYPKTLYLQFTTLG